MCRVYLVTVTIFALSFPGVAATEAPEVVATVIIHGFDSDGAVMTGVFGEDKNKDYIADIAATVNLPMSIDNPLAPNQIAYTTYYGDTYPSYYTPADIADIEAVTAEHGGGVPRYAVIIAKYAKEVMKRSGAAQVSLMGVSYGGLISRYMIEKDVEGLASSGKIARWIAIEGVLAGNYAATYGGSMAEDFFSNNYGGAAIDYQHMHYDWVTTTFGPPRGSSSSHYLGQIPCHFWMASDDNFNNRFLTFLSRKANDGVVLMEDSTLRNLEPQAKYLGLPPTESVTSTNHESTKGHMGIRAGLVAQMFGRTRVTIRVVSVEVKNEFDGGARGQGEYVFGVKVFSPLAESAMGIVQPVHQLKAQDSSFPYVRMSPNVQLTVNQVWFDDMILSGETQLRLETDVDEVDGDMIYNITEASDGTYTSLANTAITVDVQEEGMYSVETADWQAMIQVEVTNYPAFGEDPPIPNAAENWMLYQ